MALSLTVTLTGTCLGMKSCLPAMHRQGGGAIVNTASIPGTASDYGLASYNAAKAGVIDFTRSATIENARHGIPFGIDVHKKESQIWILGEGGELIEQRIRRVRWRLIHAVVSILRRRPPATDALRRWALRIAARRGKQIAVVALARRLAGILTQTT